MNSEFLLVGNFCPDGPSSTVLGNFKKCTQVGAVTALEAAVTLLGRRGALIGARRLR